MKVIISAIACTPGGGSEGGVGWRAVLRIAKHHDVRVITQSMNRHYWESAAKEGIIPGNVRVRYLDCGKAWHPNRMIARIQSWMQYVKFSKEVLSVANTWHTEEPADLIHQVTYASWRVSSQLWQMPIPFVWGPVGGTAVFPKAFLGILGGTARAFEQIRNLAGKWTSKTPNFIRCIENSAVVLAANDETFNFLLPFRKGRPLLKLPVAHLTKEQVALFRRPTTSTKKKDETLKLFAGGNIEGRKGVSLALKAIARLKQRGVPVLYTVAGGGPEIPTLKKLASELGIEAMVNFHSGYKGEEYIAKLKESDVYFLPSFRETTPVTLMEAALAGCIPVVADASAAGEMATKIGGVALQVNSPDELVISLADALIQLHADRLELNKLSQEISLSVADHYSEDRYDEAIRLAYEIATSH